MGEFKKRTGKRWGKTAVCRKRSVMIKKIVSVLFIAGLALATFSGCAGKGLLNPKKPVTLTMWHVYGEQADSPMNRYVEEFNSTVGREKGVVIDVTLMSNASQIGEKLIKAQQGKAGVPSMPDLFFCHTSNAAELGTENLVDWKKEFSEKELSEFVEGFIADGTENGVLAVLPVSKSTHLLFLAGSAFGRFAAEKKVTYQDLATWDGFFGVAEKYYEYSGGKPFCALDYLLRSVELNAISRGAKGFYSENGWYNENEVLLGSYTKFANAIAKGHIVVSDLYSNTQVMTGQTVSGISSSAAVLYYNERITYPDNHWEHTNLKILPVPQAGVGEKYATQAGVGLCAYKTTDQKTEAEKVFAQWFTEEKRNLDFVAETGYMPVKNGAFDKLSDYAFKNDGFRDTYAALKLTRDSCVFLSESNAKGYFPKTYELYGKIRNLQKELKTKIAGGATTEKLTSELVELFRGIGN